MTIIVPHGFEPNYTLGFVKGLLADGIDPYVISSDIDHARLLEAGVRSVNLRGSQDESRPAAWKVANLIMYFARLLFYLYRNKGGIVHFTGIFRNELILLEGPVLGLCFKILSNRYIYTVHNVLPHSRDKSPLFERAYRFIYRMPDMLLVHTNLAKKQLIEKFSVPEQKIIVISIGLNEEMPITALTREKARRRLGFNTGDKIILFFGKADEYKGLDTLLEAFNNLSMPSTKLLISGWFPDPVYRQKIVSCIDELDRKSDIHLHERFIPNEEVEIFFKSSDVLVLPYRNIYQSGVVFLCFNFGLPLVVTDVGSLREFVDEGMGIVTGTNDAKGVADALRQFFESQDKFKKEEIIAKATDYKWENICRVLIPLYQIA